MQHLLFEMLILTCTYLSKRCFVCCLGFDPIHDSESCAMIRTAMALGTSQPHLNYYHEISPEWVTMTRWPGSTNADKGSGCLENAIGSKESSMSRM